MTALASRGAGPGPGGRGADSSAGSSDGMGWLWEALGLAAPSVRSSGTRALPDLVGLALRRNPRRAHLLVSRVLGKHLPVSPAVALGVGRELASLLAPSALAGEGAAGPLVLGYCETATGLGHALADAVPGGHYLHTTRRPVAGVEPALSFVEPHSHADLHWLMPADPATVASPGPVVLVDDELSTGTTVLGTIRRLHEHAPHSGYSVATLLDARPAAARAAFDALADTLGVPVNVVCLVSAELVVPADAPARAAAILGRRAAGRASGAVPDGLVLDGVVLDGPAPVRRLTPSWPRDLPDGARHGWTPTHRALLDEVVPRVAADIAATLRRPDGRVLVLGTEELMYVPLRIAEALADLLGRSEGGTVVAHSTTRSPVHPLDLDGYAVRSALTFPAPDDVSRASHVYNVRPGMYDEIVVVVDSARTAPSDPSAMAAALATCAPVTVVVLPTAGPDGASL